MQFFGECVQETVEERALSCTWVLVEVRLAIQKGYKIIDIFEVYEYNVTQYDLRTREGILFVEYINTFPKIKA